MNEEYGHYKPKFILNIEGGYYESLAELNNKPIDLLEKWYTCAVFIFGGP